MEPDLDGFREASDRFREAVGRSLVYLIPTETVWPEGTPLDPETGEPYDPVIQPVASGFSSAAVTTIAVMGGATDRAAGEVEAAIGQVETGEAALVVGSKNYDSAGLKDATLVRIYDETWEIVSARRDGVGGNDADDRVIMQAKLREKTPEAPP